jgi:hypothetical protein
VPQRRQPARERERGFATAKIAARASSTIAVPSRTDIRRSDSGARAISARRSKR